MRVRTIPPVVWTILLVASTALIAAAAQLSVVVSPKVLVLSASTQWVTIHTNVPLRAVADCSVTVDGGPVGPIVTYSDARGNLVVKIRQSIIEPIVAPPRATFEVTVVTEDGTVLVGSDTITVKE